jgi:hypothetical protein
LRALAHPLAVASLVLLALNDHVLKQAWPGFVTGKLSDVAGLVVAPLVLAVPLAALGVRRCDVTAVLLTGAGFVAVKTTEAGAALASDTWTAVAGTSYIRSDPTDLLALPALLVALRVHRLVRQARPLLRERALATTGAVVLPFAVLATAATSPCDDGSSPRDIVVLEGLWRDPGAGHVRDQRLVYDYQQYELRLTGDQVGVRRLTEAEQARIDEDAVLEVQHVTAACDPRRPRLCWKSGHPAASAGGFDPTTSEETVVWASTDAGDTWTREVVLDDAAVDRLRDEAGEICGKPLRLNPGPLAVLPTDAGLVVAVTVESAGVAVRGADARWHWLPASAIEAAGHRAERDGSRTGPTASPTAAPRHPLTPVAPVRPAAWLDDRDSPSPSPTPSPPCDDPVLVTVTPDPRNGPASTQLRCPPSSSP